MDKDSSTKCPLFPTLTTFSIKHRLLQDAWRCPRSVTCNQTLLPLLSQWHHRLWKFKKPARLKKNKKTGLKTMSLSDTHKSNFKNKNSTTWENNQIKDYYFENKNKTEQSKSLLGRESRHEPQMAYSAHQNLTKSLFSIWFKYCLCMSIQWTLNIPVRQSICPVHYTICGCVKSEGSFKYF